MSEWLTAFELDTGKQKIKPYDPTVGKQIADMLRPSMGDQIPTDPDDIGAAFGLGWWKQDQQAAAELLERAGFTRRGNDWYMPDGKRFSISVMVEGEARPVMTRAGSMIAEQWRRFGIDATTDVGAGRVPDPAQRRRLRDRHLAGASRPGAAIPTSASSSTAGTRSS